MRCPFCGHHDTSVKDSRTTDDQAAVRRRRLCEECGSRFTTFERIQLRHLFVVKKNGSRVPFDRDKLAHSVAMAMHKQALDPDRVERVVSGIVRQLETSGETEIATRTIGEMAMQALYNIDPVAYVRFASVYQEFNNVNDFIEFVRAMQKTEIIE